MKCPMRLICKRGWWHVEIKRGKWKSLRTKDEKEAEALFQEMCREWRRGRLFQLEDYKKITLSHFREEYIEHGREGLSIWSVRKDALSLKLLEDVIGGSTQLRAISRANIEEFKKKCRIRGAKEITVNGYLSHIKAAFSWAVQEEYLSKKPIIKMYRKRDENKGPPLRRILHPEEIQNILKKARERNESLWRLLTVHVWTGGRRSECLSLEWPQVDFQNDMITLQGKTGERTIPMLPAVRDVLEPIRKDIGRVFADWHRDTVSHWFKEIAVSVGATEHRLHDLRHTAATYMLKSGIDLEVVQRILGHTHISTTQIYAKVLDEILKVQMKKLTYE
ncbi:MAG: tyrosine-type recombinase/integrase [Syntrophales bacterium]